MAYRFDDYLSDPTGVVTGQNPNDPLYWKDPFQAPTDGLPQGTQQPKTPADIPTGGEGGPAQPPPAEPTPTPAPSPSNPTPAVPTPDPYTPPPQPGMRWDPNTATMVPDNQPNDPQGYHWDGSKLVGNSVAATPGAAQRPTGGKLTDPDYAAKFVAWAATMPGVNPSVKTDPGYWIGRFTSGDFGSDEDYAIKRMMQAEGAPEGPGGTRNNPQALNTSLAQGNRGGINDALMSALGGLFGRGNVLLDKYSKPVSADDPLIHNVVDAFHGRSARQSAVQRERMAERAHAEGVPEGAFDAAVGNADTQRGLAENSLEAELMNNENTNRRGALQSMFGSELGLLGTGLGANNTRTGLDNQNQQFYDNLSWLMSSYGNTLDAQLAHMLGLG